MKIADLRYYLENALDEFEDRHYLGMSAISQCPRKLYREMVNGRSRPDVRSARMFHEGYLHEYDIVQRLVEQGIEVKNRQRELIASWDERFRGHIDGELDGELIEIKSVNDDRFETVKQDGVFGDHMAQVQMYCRYGGYPSAVLIYKNRSTGELWMANVCYVKELADQLEAKAKAILAAVDSKSVPACTCGRCRQ